MLGKLMVSIMEKLGNGEPIKMIVDIKNPEVMMDKTNNRQTRSANVGGKSNIIYRNLKKREAKEEPPKEITDEDGNKYTYDPETKSFKADHDDPPKEITDEEGRKYTYDHEEKGYKCWWCWG